MIFDLTKDEITLILDKINDGKLGYSEDSRIARLQAKLSILLEVKIKAEQHGFTEGIKTGTD